MKTNQKGFTLIELMIVVVVIAVLAAIAYPSYTRYVQRSNRSAAEQLMLEIANREIQYFQDARAYTSTLGSGGLNVLRQGWTCSATCTDGKTYTIQLTTVAGPPPAYYIKATAQGSQGEDGDLYYNATAAGVYSEGTRSRTKGDGKW